jgi:hypothetical protein
MVINSKKKGKAFERLIANDIKASGADSYARRSIMSGAVFEPGDLKTRLPFYIEAKHRKNINVYAFWHQIKEEIAKRIGTTKRPLVVMRKDGEDILAVMGWYDWLEMYKYAEEGGYK